MATNIIVKKSVTLINALDHVNLMFLKNTKYMNVDLINVRITVLSVIENVFSLTTCMIILL